MRRFIYLGYGQGLSLNVELRHTISDVTGVKFVVPFGLLRVDNLHGDADSTSLVLGRIMLTYMKLKEEQMPYATNKTFKPAPKKRTSLLSVLFKLALLFTILITAAWYVTYGG